MGPLSLLRIVLTISILCNYILAYDFLLSKIETLKVWDKNSVNELTGFQGILTF